MKKQVSLQQLGSRLIVVFRVFVVALVLSGLVSTSAKGASFLQVLDFFKGPDYYWFSAPFAVGNGIFLPVGVGVNYHETSEVWYSDGTPYGFYRVSVQFPGDGSGDTELSWFAHFQNKVYFVLSEELGNYHLWRADENGRNSQKVGDLSGIGWLDHLAVSGGKLYLLFENPSNRMELWRWDETSSQAKLIKTLDSASVVTTKPVEFKQALYFVTYNVPAGYSLWKSDGSEAGTVPIYSYPDTCNLSGAYPGGTETSMAVLGDLLFFAGCSESQGMDLYQTDGVSGAQPVADTIPGPTGVRPAKFVALDGWLYYSASADHFEGDNSGSKLLRTKGTSTGVQMLKSYTHGSPINMMAYQSEVYFLDSGTGKLWKTNGTPSGTVEFAPSLGFDNAYPGAVVNERLYFYGITAKFGSELWSTDGTLAGTRRETDINPGSANASPGFFTPAGDRLFFSATDPTHGKEMWVLYTNWPLPPAAPTDIGIDIGGNTYLGIDENSPVGSVLGDLYTVDQNIGDTFTYALVGGDGSADNSDFTISQNTLLTAKSFNHEAKQRYSIRVRSTDQTGQFVEKPFEVLIYDVNETATQVYLNAPWVRPGAPAGTRVGALYSNDPDLYDQFTYTLVSGGGGRFEIRDGALYTTTDITEPLGVTFTISVNVRDAANTGPTAPSELTIIVLEASYLHIPITFR